VKGIVYGTLGAVSIGLAAFMVFTAIYTTSFMLSIEFIGWLVMSCSLFTLGGFALSSALSTKRISELERVLEEVKKASLTPRGEVLFIPFDRDIMGAYLMRSGFQRRRVRRVEGVRGR